MSANIRFSFKFDVGAVDELIIVFFCKVSSFDIINALLYFFLSLKFVCVGFATNYIDDTHIFNLILKGCGYFIKILIVWCCGNSWSFRRWIFWSYNNQFVSNYF